MLDTVRLRSPFVSRDLAQAVTASLVWRSGIDIRTGEVLYSLTNGALEGSWDHRISVRVDETEWRRPVSTASRRGRSVSRQRVPVQMACLPYVTIEGSVHKALMGHNVWGGPLDAAAGCRWLIADMSRRLGVQLPAGGLWTVEQADWAECYELPSFAAVEEYFRGVNSCPFPRRTVSRFGSQSLHCPGVTTTIKLYHKGPEFYKHDRKRLSVFAGDGEGELDAEGLQDLAHRILRCEVSIRARKLEELQTGKPAVDGLCSKWLAKVHDDELGRLLKEGQSDMQIVRQNREVSARLKLVYSSRRANLLFGTWMQLAALGEEVTKASMGRTAFYRQRAWLADAGVSWHGADVCIKPSISLVPAGFSPVRSDPRRLSVESPLVVAALQPYRRAA